MATKHYFQIPRLSIPDNIAPDDTWCVQVNIPGDTAYIEQLGSVLKLLTYSANFARDEEHNAAQVSRLWQAALESRPIEECGDTMQYSLQQNAENNCQLLQSRDGGETWELAFDFSLCKPASQYPAPWINDAELRDWLADMFEEFQQWIVEQALSATDKPGWISAVHDRLDGYGAGSEIDTLLDDVWDAIQAASSPDDFTEVCAWVDSFAYIYACANYDAGSFLEKWSDWLVCAISSANDDIVLSLNTLAQALGAEFMSAFVDGEGSGGGGSSYGSECTWSHTFDFTIDQQGFSPFFFNGEGRFLGEYDPGVGWKSVITGSGYHQLQIVRQHQQRTLTAMAHPDIGSNVNPAGHADYIAWPVYTDWLAFYEHPAVGVRFISTSYDATPLWIAEATVTGIGIDPFI